MDWRSGPDGILDDCYSGGDGIPDPYTMNPVWGEMLRVGNLNSTNYDAAVLEVTRREWRGLQLVGSYTWSRAIGQAEDFDQLLGNDRTALDEERGPLAYDQTHVLKVEGVGRTPGGFRIGGMVRWESGLPFSEVRATSTSLLVAPQGLGGVDGRSAVDYLGGSRNGSRNPAFWTFDARISREWRLAGQVFGTVWVDAFNLLNDDVSTTRDVTSGTPNTVRRFGRRWQAGLRVAF